METPKRFVSAYEELFRGYQECPVEILDRTFSETGGYDQPVLVRDIPFYSHCEHHMMPFTGKAHIAYLPTGRVVGLSKIARLIDVYARRLQTQEHLTAQIATAIEEILNPRGVAVMLEAEHTCMSMRGVSKPGSTPSRPSSPASSTIRRSRPASSRWCARRRSVLTAADPS